MVKDGHNGYDDVVSLVENVVIFCLILLNIQ